MSGAASEPSVNENKGFSDVRKLGEHVLLAGMANSMGQTVGHPFDLLKLRLQLQGRGTHSSQSTKKYNGIIHGLGVVYREEGAKGLFTAWRISVVREAWYSGLRMGLYEPSKELIGATNKAQTALWQKVAAGCISGVVASTLSNPLDLLKVRYQAAIGAEYRALPSPTRALVDLARTEGFRGLWRGYIPNTSRAAGITAVQLSAYDHVKHTLLNADLLQEGRILHFTTSFIASLFSIALTNWVDVVKTRMMQSHEHRTMRECLSKIVRHEGVHGMFKGSTASWLRLGPHTVVTFMSFEHMRVLCGVAPL